MGIESESPTLGTAAGESLREARRELYRRQVLNAAELEFGRSGYADAKMSAIAHTAGLSLATVYKTFAGKSEIWDALHAARMKQLLAETSAAMSQARTPLDRIVVGVAEVAAYLTRQPAYLDMSIHAGGGWAAAPEGVEGVQRTVWGAGLDMIETGIRAAVESGDVRQLRPRIAAGLVVSALQLWLTDWVTDGRDRPADQVIAELRDYIHLILAPSRSPE